MRLPNDFGVDVGVDLGGVGIGVGELIALKDGRILISGDQLLLFKEQGV
jgi:flagellar motor switch/type III secretory pathway protein FliN